MTNTELFEAIYALAESSGELAKMQSIEDYHLAEDFYVEKLTSYEFNVHFIVDFGGSEGIYIDGYLVGNFNDLERTRLKLCTIKTLRDDLDAMKIMGEACGILTYYASEFINKNLDSFKK